MSAYRSRWITAGSTRPKRRHRTREVPNKKARTTVPVVRAFPTVS
ncbi:hypothetical protein GA0115233_10831, partial [Streptomyces sp. DI166]